jgi:hypothetical protein
MMALWLVSFVVLFGIVQLYHWLAQVLGMNGFGLDMASLPLPVLILAGVALAMASNATPQRWAALLSLATKDLPRDFPQDRSASQPMHPAESQASHENAVPTPANAVRLQPSTATPVNLASSKAVETPKAAETVETLDTAGSSNTPPARPAKARAQAPQSTVSYTIDKDNYRSERRPS